MLDQPYTPDEDEETPYAGEMQTTELSDDRGRVYQAEAYYKYSPTQRFVSFRNNWNNGIDAEASRGHDRGLINFSLYHVFGGQREEDASGLCAPAEVFEAIIDMLDATLDEDAVN